MILLTDAGMYFMTALVVAVIAAVVMLRRLEEDLEPFDYFMGSAAGFAAGMAWPLTVVFAVFTGLVLLGMKLSYRYFPRSEK